MNEHTAPVVEAFSRFMVEVVKVALQQIEAERAEAQRLSGSKTELVRPKEAAERLAIGKTTLYKLKSEGVLVPVETEFGPRYRLQDLDRYIQRLAKE
jgi:excisionase family DNA binding protein